MRQNFINFISVRQTSLSCSLTQTVDVADQPQAKVWFYCFILSGLIALLLFTPLAKQLIFIKQQLRFQLFNLIKHKFKQTRYLKNE